MSMLQTQNIYFVSNIKFITFIEVNVLKPFYLARLKELCDGVSAMMDLLQSVPEELFQDPNPLLHRSSVIGKYSLYMHIYASIILLVLRKGYVSKQ